MASNHKNAYPHFMPNQLLKSSTLNGYFAFLDEQTRLSRVHFMGRGIVEGLGFSVTEDALTIQPGVALNKDGWLVQVPDKTEYKYAVGVPFSMTAFNSDDLEDLLDQGGSHISWICFPTEEDAQEYVSQKGLAITAVSELELGDYVVALAYGKWPEHHGRCSQGHCNVNTADELLEIWPVLIPVNNLSGLFQKMAPLGCAVPTRNEPALEYYHGGVGMFNDQVRTSAISWESEINKAMGLISSHFDLMDQGAKDHLFTDGESMMDMFSQAKKTIHALVGSASKDDIPDYYISFFGDMVTALNEFVAGYNDFVGKYGLVPNVIPDDILVYLGRPDEGMQKDRNVYRSIFRSAMKEEFQKDAYTLTRLLRRICVLPGCFISKPSDEKISRWPFYLEKARPGGCLSSRPVPFYYDTAKEGFYEAWYADKAYADGSFDIQANKNLNPSGSMNDEGWYLYPRAYQGKDLPAVKSALDDLNKSLRLAVDFVEAGLNPVDKLSATDAKVLTQLVDSYSGTTAELFEKVRQACPENGEAFNLALMLGNAFDTHLVESLRDGLPLVGESYQAICEQGEIDDPTVSEMVDAIIKVFKKAKKTVDEDKLPSAFLNLIHAWENSFISLAKGVKPEEVGKSVSMAPIKRGCRVLLFTAPGNDKKGKTAVRKVVSYGVVYRNQWESAQQDSPAQYGFKMRTRIQIGGEFVDDVPSTVNPFGSGEWWDISNNELILYPYVTNGSKTERFETAKSNIECVGMDKGILDTARIEFLDQKTVPAIILKMVGNGTTMVTLLIKDSKGGIVYQKSVTINVDNPVWNIVPVTRVAVSPTVLEMFLGDTRQLSVRVEPSDATDKEVVWKSKNESIAKVSSDGVLMPVKEGKTEIKAIAKSDESKFGTSTLQVSSLVFRMRAVAKDGSKFFADLPTGSFNPFEPMADGSVWDCVNDDFVICPYKTDGSTVAPYMTTRANLVGESLDERIMTTKTGMHPDNTSGSIIVLRMQAHKNGKAKATLRVIRSEKIICSRDLLLNVHNPEWDKVPVTGVSLTKTQLELIVGQTEKLEAIVIPDNATNKKVTWVSSFKSIASVVESTGILTAYKMGGTVVTVRTDDGTLTKQMKVVVPSLLFRGQLSKPGKSGSFDDLPDVLERGQWLGTTFMKIYPFKKYDKSVVKQGDPDMVQMPLDPANLVVVSGSNVGTQILTEDGKYPYIKLLWPKKAEKDYEITLQIKDPKDPGNILYSRTFSVKGY